MSSFPITQLLHQLIPEEYSLVDGRIPVTPLKLVAQSKFTCLKICLDKDLPTIPKCGPG